MNVLVLAPHPDDEAIGCGGTLSAHTAAGDRVIAAFLTSGERGLPALPSAEATAIREREAEESCAVLGVAASHFYRLPDWQLWGHLPQLATMFAQLIEAEQPDRIYLPHADEWHPDHQACFFAAARAIALAGLPPGVGRAYEIWTPLQLFRHVEDITSVLRIKMRAIRCHASQVSQYRYDRAMRGLNGYRGVTTGKGRYCEVFADPRLAEEAADPSLRDSGAAGRV